MILNSNSSTVTTVGDVQEHAISIDADNLEHIISILSTNLYSKPEQSFLREIVSNAIDAQVEANSKEPAIISMAYDSSSGKYILAIRDYGTGISPERFKEIYLNIGSSTKRESNDYIGSFGIGRFSALACADMVHITSYYEGTQYQYVMLKNGTRINVDLIAEVPTEEHNGVEVKIRVGNLMVYKNALRYLWFVPNIYVNEEYAAIDSESHRFNNRELFNFKTFSYNNIGDSSKCFVLLGNIVYPIDEKYIPASFNTYHDIDDVWERVIPRFTIGELDVTPNREQLLYSDKTKKAIEKKYNEVAEELIEMCKKESEKECDNILQFYHLANSHFYDLYLRETSCNLMISETCFLRKHINYKYKNDDPLARDKMVWKAIETLRWKSLGKVFNNLIVFEDASFYTKKQIDGGRTRRGGVDLRTILSGDVSVRLFYVPGPEKLRSDIFKRYLTEKASAFDDERMLFMFTWDKPSYKSFIKADGISVLQEGSYSAIDWHKSLWFIRELKKVVKLSIYKYDPVNSKDYQQFRAGIIEKVREERKENVKKFSQNIRFYVEIWKKDRCYNYRNDRVDAKDIDDLINKINMKSSYYLNKKIVPVYWSLLDDPYVSILKGFRGSRQDMIVITVAKTNARYLEKAELPSNWQRISLDMLMNSREMRRYMTYKDKQVCTSAQCMNVLNRSKDSSLLDCAYKASNYHLADSAVTYLPEFKQMEQKYTGPYDFDMLAGYDLIDKYNKISSSLHGILTLGNGEMTPLSSYVALKRKLFRPNWGEYHKIVKSLKRKELAENEKDN